MLRAVFFDIDNTLFPTAKFAEIARRNSIRALVAAGLPFEEEFLYSRLQQIIRKHGANDPKHFDRLLYSLNWTPEPRLLAATIVAYHNTKLQLAPYPGTQRTLLTLREKGVRLYAVTQGKPVKQWDKLYRLGIALLFDDVFVTEEEKTPELFRRLLKQLHLKPSEALMVGDREDSDILPAKGAGIRTVHLTRGPYGKTPSKKADYRIEHLHDLLKITEKLRR